MCRKYKYTDKLRKFVCECKKLSMQDRDLGGFDNEECYPMTTFDETVLLQLHFLHRGMLDT